MVKKGLMIKVVCSVVVGLTILLIGISYAKDACTPSISELTPNLGPPWMIVTIHGEKFGTEPRKGDAVFVGSQVAPIYSWSDTLIKFRVPVGLSLGIYNITVKKVANPLTGCGEETSNQLPFEVTNYPRINTVDPMESTCGQQLNIYGKGFGSKQEEVNTDGFGYSTYVELYASADQYRITQYPDGWLGPDHIKIRLKNLFDVNTGLEVPEQHLYHGTWNLKVITDYFIDDGDGIHNLGLNGLDIEDEIMYRATSNPISLQVTPCENSRPDIKTNGSDGPITLNQSDTLSIIVALDNNDITDNADWWLAADTPSGLWFFTFEGWTDNWQPVYQGPLFYLDSFHVIVNMPLSGLPTGAYTLYFGVDTDMDGNITSDSLYYDSVVVNVTE